ncbi:MAG: hypothetical protein QM640_17635 [Niabella sp.]
MAKSTKDQSTKKVIRQEIIVQLENALSNLRDLLGEKKFNSRIRKASKLLTENVEKFAKAKKTAKHAPQKKKKNTGKTSTAAPVAKKEPVVQKTAVKKTAPRKTAAKKASPKKSTKK